MKKIGLVSGLGWPATAAYYSAICSAAREHCPGGSPRMMIESLDMAETLAARGEPGDDGSRAAFDAFFVDALNRLHQGGCDIAAIASATPHARLARMVEGTSIPIVSILDATAEALDKVKTGRGLVLGTPVTMQSGLFDTPLRDRGIEPLGPEGQEDIAAFADLLNGYFYAGRAEDGRVPVLDYFRQRISVPGDTIVVLGCTDLAPAFPDGAGRVVFDAEEMAFLDTMQAHVRSILEAALA
jgi:aspartate racemase